MSDYEIIDKSSLPPSRWGKWRTLFDSLAFDKAVKFICETRTEAYGLAKSIQSSTRQRNPGFSIHCQVRPKGKIFNLYVWKEKGRDRSNATYPNS